MMTLGIRAVQRPHLKTSLGVYLPPSMAKAIEGVAMGVSMAMREPPRAAATKA